MTSKALYSLIISNRAEKEIADSWEWYEDRQQTLGDRFVTEAVNALNLIQTQPEFYSVKFKSYRCTALKHFPVTVIYKINSRKKSIRIISVFHTARKFKDRS